MTESQEKMNDRTFPVEEAVQSYVRGFSCSQALLSAFAPHLGLDKSTALKLAAGFGGGLARQGKTCGAVTGAMLVLGLRYGSTSVNDREAKELTYSKIQELNQLVINRFKSVECNRITGYDISSELERKQAKENNVFDEICPGVVRAAAEMVTELI